MDPLFVLTNEGGGFVVSNSIVSTLSFLDWKGMAANYVAGSHGFYLQTYLLLSLDNKNNYII